MSERDGHQLIEQRQGARLDEAWRPASGSPQPVDTPSGVANPTVRLPAPSRALDIARSLVTLVTSRVTASTAPVLKLVIDRRSAPSSRTLHAEAGQPTKWPKGPVRPRDARLARVLRAFAPALLLLLVSSVAGAVTSGPDPSLWRLVARGSGLAALALLGLGVLGALADGNRPVVPGSRRLPKLNQAHGYLGMLAVVFTLLHLVSVLFAPDLDIGLVQLLVPFTRASGPLAQACGVLAADLLLAVALTSGMIRTVPPRWRRRVHQFALPLFAVACLHSVLAESGSGALLLGLRLAVGMLLGCLLLLRLRSLWRPAFTLAAPALAAGTVASPAAGTRTSRPTGTRTPNTLSTGTLSTGTLSTGTLSTGTLPAKPAGARTSPGLHAPTRPTRPRPGTPQHTTPQHTTPQPGATQSGTTRGGGPALVPYSPPNRAAGSMTAPTERITPPVTAAPVIPAPNTPTPGTPPRTPAYRLPASADGAAWQAATQASMPTLSVLVTQLTWEADGVVSALLTSLNGAPLPPWQPGAHVELALPSGRIRHYSLYGNPAERDRYRIAIQRLEDGRGGSVEAHDELRVGTTITISPPRNGFRLRPAPSYLLIAGGIGITALLPIARALATLGEQWRLVYAARSRARMALVEHALGIDPTRVDIAPTDRTGRPDLRAIIAAQGPGTAVYCCGPPSMVAAVRELTAARPDLSLHTERFSVGVPSVETTQPTEPTDPPPVQVKLDRTGALIEVPPHRSILACVADLVPALAGGCEKGVCGRCQVSVLDGEPQHCDSLLSDAERAAGQMLLCVSRARGRRLTLDL